MGKITRYHPVSLNVIRGCVEFYNFKFGKITQLKADFETCTACYSAPIDRFPADAPDNPEALRQQLDRCFLQHIKVTDVRYIHGKYIATVAVHLVGSHDQMRFA